MNRSTIVTAFRISAATTVALYVYLWLTPSKSTTK